MSWQGQHVTPGQEGAQAGNGVDLLMCLLILLNDFVKY